MNVRGVHTEGESKDERAEEGGSEGDGKGCDEPPQFTPADLRQRRGGTVQQTDEEMAIASDDERKSNYLLDTPVHSLRHKKGWQSHWVKVCSERLYRARAGGAHGLRSVVAATWLWFVSSPVGRPGIFGMEQWEVFASRRLPPRNTWKRTMVMGLIVAAVVLGVIAVAIGVGWGLWSMRGHAMLAVGGELAPEEAVAAGVPLERVVNPAALPRNIYDDDDGETKLRKYRQHEQAFVVPSHHLAVGCGVDIVSEKLRVRTGQFSATGPRWDPWPPVENHAYVPSDFVLAGVRPLLCDNPEAAVILDLNDLTQRAWALMHNTGSPCLTAPHLGINATFIILNLAASDVRNGPEHPMLYVAMQPRLSLGGGEREIRDHDDACTSGAPAPVRWRHETAYLDFVSAADAQNKHLTIVGMAAMAVQHCMDFFERNPCA